MADLGFLPVVTRIMDKTPAGRPAPAVLRHARQRRGQARQALPPQRGAALGRRGQLARRRDDPPRLRGRRRDGKKDLVQQPRLGHRPPHPLHAHQAPRQEARQAAHRRRASPPSTCTATSRRPRATATSPRSPAGDVTRARRHRCRRPRRARRRRRARHPRRPAHGAQGVPAPLGPHRPRRQRGRRRHRHAARAAQATPQTLLRKAAITRDAAAGHRDVGRRRRARRRGRRVREAGCPRASSRSAVSRRADARRAPTPSASAPTATGAARVSRPQQGSTRAHDRSGRPAASGPPGRRSHRAGTQQRSHAPADAPRTRQGSRRAGAAQGKPKLMVGSVVRQNGGNRRRSLGADVASDGWVSSVRRVSDAVAIAQVNVASGRHAYSHILSPGFAHGAR